MGFLNPALVWGFGAISVPIIIHLLNRYRFRRTIWAAMKFLLEAIEENSRRIQIQDIILLIIRILVLMLIACALIRPSLTGHPPAILKESKRSGVIILDNSYSMGYQALSKTSFDTAKGKALDILNELKGGRAALILMSGKAQAIVSAPSTDIRLLKQIVKDAGVSDGATDLLASVQKAYDIIENLKSPAKEVYIITDCQANAWSRHKEELKNLLEKLSSKAKVFIVESGSDTTEHNLGISDFKLRDSGINVNEPALFSVTVTNYGSAEQAEVPLSVWLNNNKVDQKIISSISAMSSVTVQFLLRVNEPGLHRLWVELPPDRLSADNKRYLAIEAFKALKALVIEGKPSFQRFKGAGDFLKVALSPYDEDAPEKTYLFTVDTITPAELAGKRISEYHVVVMLNVAQLDAQSTDELKRYVETRGALFISLGDRVSPEYYNRLADEERPFLPARLKYVMGDPQQRHKALHLSAQNLTHPVVSFFANEMFKKFILLPNFYAAYELETTGKDVKLVLPFGNGSPALLEKKYGQGRVMMYASTMGLGWNDMPVTPTFLMLMRRCMEFLAGQDPARRNVIVHSSIIEPLTLSDVNTRVIMSDPKGHNKELTVSVRGQDNVFIEVDRAEYKGFYTFTIVSTPPETICFSSNVDPEESDLRSLRRDEIKKDFPGFKFEYIGPAEGIKEILKRRHSGAELWWQCMVLGFLLMIVESCLARYFGPKE